MAANAHEPVVVKSNKLIEACYRLDLVQLRIIMMSVMVSRELDVLTHGPDRDQCKPFKIEARRFMEFYPMEEGSVYGQIRDAVKSINRKPITYIEMIGGKECPAEIPWFTKSVYIAHEGAIQLQFNEHVIPYISRLESQFTEYRLAKIGRLTSTHAIRLYEILFQYLAAGRRDIDIAWLKKTLMIEGEYKLVAELKRRVIDPAVKQINEFTDLNVSYEPKKKGRTIVSFMFTIKMKPEHKPKEKQKPIDNAFVEKHARPGEKRGQAFGRLINERAKRKPPKRPEQMSILEKLAEPVNQNPDDPKVQSARAEARAALKKMRAKA